MRQNLFWILIAMVGGCSSYQNDGKQSSIDELKNTIWTYTWMSEHPETTDSIIFVNDTVGKYYDFLDDFYYRVIYEKREDSIILSFKAYMSEVNDGRTLEIFQQLIFKLENDVLTQIDKLYRYEDGLESVFNDSIDCVKWNKVK